MPTSDTEATDLAEASDAVAEAEDQLTTAQTALDEKQAGPKASEVVTAQVALDAATRKVADTAAAGDAARAEAVAAVDAAVLKLNAELADRASTPAERAEALAALAAAVLDADAAHREATEADLGAAEAVQTAQADLAELTAPPDADAEMLAVEQAQGSVDRATEALASLQARSGAIVPRGEIVFLDVLPATVISLSGERGRRSGRHRRRIERRRWRCSPRLGCGSSHWCRRPTSSCSPRGWTSNCATTSRATRSRRR